VLRSRLFGAIKISLTVGVFAVPSIFSQTRNKTIEWPKVSVFNAGTKTGPHTHVTDRIDEIEIEAIMVEGHSVTIGEPFSAGDDWLKSMAFRVRNISGKQVKSVQITLVLPEMTFESPDIPFIDESAGVGNPKFISPGAEVELTVPSAGLYPCLVSRITERGSLARISRAEIHIIYVTSAEGTVWSSRCLKTVDPRNACPRAAP
jgi:hypothetical protein